MSIAFIGEEDYILGFSGLGVSIFPVADAAGAGQALDKLEKEGYSIVFITETFAGALMEKIDNISIKTKMNISIIPGSGKKQNLAGERMTRIAVRATGMEPGKQE